MFADPGPQEVKMATRLPGDQVVTIGIKPETDS